MNKRNIIIGLGAIILAIAWYAFRPELLFVNKTVREEFAGGPAIASIGLSPSGLVAIPDESLGFTKGFLARDPDDHRLQLIEK